MEASVSQPGPRGRLRICLAASGGGHVRQLLDLKAVWSQHDHFFVTEETALGQTLAGEHRTHFVPHFAWGQARLGTPFRMIGRALVSLVRSAAIVWRERPELVISSGAGAVFFVVLWARLFGARVVVLESFARFERPSLFGRLASPLAHDMIIQSPKLAARYPRARLFDPFVILERSPQPKAPLVFATVGATLPFDRLVDMVATAASEGRIPERIVIQTGVGGRAPAGLEVHETLPFDRVQELLRSASIVVCHGGTGSLITALREGCQVIAVPRLPELKEHYDNHQAEITEAFAARGLVQVVKTMDEFREALASARTREPRFATTDPAALIDYLQALTEQLARARSDPAR
jgi:UDP-N-acetylglucosamine--N-acetylmuramyl-(pentapeptide) pyrophosphoryl-undecaprenol N-acetylglucosamine transferase